MIGKKWILRIISLSAAAIIGTGLGVGDSIALGNGNNLDQILCPPIVDGENVSRSSAKGQAMSQELIEEGIVLLKNDNNVLPLDKDVTDKVNIFGWASIDWAYGANSTSCSGRVMAENNRESELIDLYDALSEYGIEYNTELQAMYKRYANPYVYALKDPGAVSNDGVITLHEPDIDNKTYYSDELLANAKKYSDTAIVVITRNAGEDIPADRAMRKAGAGYKSESGKIYLDYSIEEANLLRYVGDNYDNVVVIINSPVAMDMSFLDTIPGLSAAIQVGFTGTHGAYGIPRILYGEKSPSGHLVDTVAYDRNTTFAMKSKKGGSLSTNRGNKRYFEYLENIYVGYRWYETADEEGYWDDYELETYDATFRPVTKTGYDAVVQYPFGYGLSYTKFDWELFGVEILDKGEPVTNITPTADITFKIKVTNTGSHAGKDVVECYVTPPYHNHEIEKSAVSLVGYEKTIELKPGEYQVVDVKVDMADVLSYDCYDLNDNHHTGYELDRGKYQFKFMTDSHNIKVGKKENTLQNLIVSYDINETINADKDKYTGAIVENMFTGEDALDGYPIDSVEESYAPDYLTRSGFKDVKDFTGLKSRTASTQLNNAFYFTDAKGTAWDNAEYDIFGEPVFDEDVVWGKNNNLKIYANNEVTDTGYQLGEDYDDPLWEDVLEQVTVQETLNTINKSYGTPAVPSVGKPACSEVDGPAQIKCYYQQAPRGTGYPSAINIAQTWNLDLIEAFGLSYAADMNSVGIFGVWGWGCNIHRTPVGGRNWEYFSEDPFISGMTLAAAVRGLNNGGRYDYIKHFCLNETEENKVEGFTFVTEQAYREIYLKPFQIGIQKGGALGVMTSFNRIGALYSGGSEASLTGVLRREWGFKGSIITDWANNGPYMSIDHQLRAGGDLGMNTELNDAGTHFTYGTGSTKRLQHQMKEVMHHVLYTYLRSQYLNKVYNEDPNTGTKFITSQVIESWKYWRVLLVDANIALLGGALLFVVMTFLPKKEI